MERTEPSGESGNLSRLLTQTNSQTLEFDRPVKFLSTVEFSEIPESPTSDLPSGTTPSVLNLTRIRLVNTSPVTITNFFEGREGQQISVLGDGQTTLQNGTFIRTNTAANKLLLQNQVYTFTLINEVWVESASSIISVLTSALAADVQLPTTNAWVDGPSVTLTPGTWLVTGYVTFLRTTALAKTWAARLSDKTLHFASTQAFVPALANASASLTLITPVTVAANTQVFLQGLSSAGAVANLMRAANLNGPSGNVATRITAVRLA